MPVDLGLALSLACFIHIAVGSTGLDQVGDDPLFLINGAIGLGVEGHPLLRHGHGFAAAENDRRLFFLFLLFLSRTTDLFFCSLLHQGLLCHLSVKTTKNSEGKIVNRRSTDSLTSSLLDHLCQFFSELLLTLLHLHPGSFLPDKMVLINGRSLLQIILVL